MMAFYDGVLALLKWLHFWRRPTVVRVVATTPGTAPLRDFCIVGYGGRIFFVMPFSLSKPATHVNVVGQSLHARLINPCTFL